MQLSHRLASRIALALFSGLVATAALADFAPETSAPSVRVLFLDKLGARSAQKLLMAEGVRRVATYDPGRAVILADSPEKVAELEAVLRKADPGLLSKEPHAPVAMPEEGALMVDRVFDTTDAKGGTVMLRTIYGIESLEPGRDGHKLHVRTTADQLEAAEALLRILGLLAS